ncbi:MAG: hypothetical protein PHN39_03930 [Candidatus Pacebacteria bacterium]|nr:hypothetical protein [Candidatus Paceibacterota bacterium]
MEGYKHFLLLFIVIALIFAIAIIVTQHDFLAQEAKKLWRERKQMRENEKKSERVSEATGQAIEGEGITLLSFYSNFFQHDN